MSDPQIAKYLKGFWFHSLKRIIELGAREISEGVHDNISVALELFLCMFKQCLRLPYLHCTVPGHLGSWQTTTQVGSHIIYSYSYFSISSYFCLVILSTSQIYHLWTTKS